MAMHMDAEKPTVPRCVVCAQPAEKLKCIKCKTSYCSVACQTVDWKERGHKKECKRLVKEAATKPRNEARTTSPSPTPKAAPPVVDGPARSRADVARTRAAAAAATATTAPEPEPEHWRGSPRCPVCFEDWDENQSPAWVNCCGKIVCRPCTFKLALKNLPCPLCRAPLLTSNEEGLAMLRRCAETSNPAAIRHLGAEYETGGLGLVPSHKKAVRLFHRAADLGNVQAMDDLGRAYRSGEGGVKIDKKKAVKYYRMAADRGHAKAQNNLGLSYTKGFGVALDYAEAMRLFKLAAAQGYSEAENNLGFMYLYGNGVARDLAEAVRWWERAAAKGNEDAERRLASAPPGLRDSFKKHIFDGLPSRDSFKKSI